MKLVMEKRLAPSPLMRSLVPVVAAFAALVFCGIFFAVTGRDPFEVYYAMFSGALGSEYGISETIVKMIPLAMCGLGIAIAFRMQIWNIGAEGQFYMGACAASWLPLTYPAGHAAVGSCGRRDVGTFSRVVQNQVAGQRTDYDADDELYCNFMGQLSGLWCVA